MFNKRKTKGTVDYSPIFMPMIIGLCIFGIAIIIAVLTNNIKAASMIAGLSGLVIASSGYWQIKMKVVPGYPTLRGGCAIAFGLCFLIFVSAIGIGLIVSTILGI